MDDMVYVLSMTAGIRSTYLISTQYSDSKVLNSLDHFSQQITKALVFDTEIEAGDYRANVAANSHWQIQPVSKKKLFTLRLASK